MRYCENEEVRVYEGAGPNLSTLLRDAADLADGHGGYVNVTSEYECDSSTYRVTVYLHA